jgi:ABC-type transport system substrate-binding protein
LTYTFYISPDAYFHNGKPVEAQDVVYSFEQLASAPLLTNSSCFVMEISGAEEYRNRQKSEIAGLFIIDKKTLAITLRRPFPAFGQYLAGPGGYIIPQPADVSTSTEIGAGPYRIKWRDLSATVLEPNSDVGNAAYLDSLRFVNFTSVDEAGLAFELGRLDVINLLGESSPKFVTRGNYTSYNSNTSVYAVLGFNNNHPFQADQNFARAISFLLDRDSIIRVLLGNSAAKPIFENSDGRKLSLPLYGQFFPDSVDYYLSQLSNKPQILSFYVDSNYPILSKVARYIEGQLQSKGIKLREVKKDLRTVERDQARSDLDIYITFDVPSAANPDCIFFPLLSYSLSDQTNYLYYKDEASQTFLDNLRTETDPDRRESLALGLAQTCAVDPPVIFLYQPYLTTITKLDISGTAINPSGYIDFRRAFIETER